MTTINTAEYCCVRPGKSINLSIPSDYPIARVGDRDLLFSPLRNSPRAPRLALVGITPGGQSNTFIKLAPSIGVREAAKKAAFKGSHPEIKKLLMAHSFAAKIGIDIERWGDLNDCPEILTTSVVKCCLKKNDGYQFEAPDIVATPAAHECATNRLVQELGQYSSLEWVAVFGEPAWAALEELQIQGKSVLNYLKSEYNLKVLQFPHFVNNWKQKQEFLSQDIQQGGHTEWQAKVRSWKRTLCQVVDV